MKPNPYRPGAGLMPTYIAGRESVIDDVSAVYDALLVGIPSQSVIFSGLRGVGKTVLINRLQEIAGEKGIFSKYIEIEEKKDFVSQIASCSQAYLREVSMGEKLRTIVQRGMDAVKALSLSFDPGSGNFSLSVQDKELYTSYNLTQSMSDVFTAIGEVAKKSGRPVCFFIDEIQYMKQEELSALISALHRSNQLGYPLIVVAAGLPKIFKMLSDVKSYAERLFSYREISNLDAEQAKRAVIEPAKKVGVDFEEAAVTRIYEITKGYPFFIQQLCQLVYRDLEGNKIRLQDVEEITADYYRTLDEGFFKARYERCSDTEKLFTFAMTRCDVLPCEIGAVAKILRKKTSSVSPQRAQLINKGIIYAVRHSELDFTVPEYDGFIRRRSEYRSWSESTD